MNPNPMDSEADPLTWTRRHFLATSPLALGALALRWLGGSQSDETAPARAPRARRVIYLFQSGGPAQQDLLDPKPLLVERNGEELPDEIRRGQRLTGMSGNQSSLPLAGSVFRFDRFGECGASFSELLPHTAKLADRLCIVRSVHTEAINHDPAITFFLTGSQLAGRPSMGSWVSYGLGSENQDLPTFIVMVTNGPKDQPLYQRLWDSAFLPSSHQGVQFRAGKDPVLFLNNPEGLSRPTRRRMLDALARLSAPGGTTAPDPTSAARISQYELAYRMQTSVPEVADVSGESAETLALYGDEVQKPGSYASCCLRARRLAERGVRFIQVFHQGWDQHDNCPAGLRRQCRDTDQASAALVEDLARRGLLEDTLVVWGGEFGRTSYSQGRLEVGNYGRDHHPRCFSYWLAGGGVHAGTTFGETDDFGYNVVKDPVHVHDLQATILHLLGLEHERLTFLHQGRRFRLTDVSGRVVPELLA